MEDADDQGKRAGAKKHWLISFEQRPPDYYSPDYALCKGDFEDAKTKLHIFNVFSSCGRTFGLLHLQSARRLAQIKAILKKIPSDRGVQAMWVEVDSNSVEGELVNFDSGFVPKKASIKSPVRMERVVCDEIQGKKRKVHVEEAGETKGEISEADEALPLHGRMKSMVKTLLAQTAETRNQLRMLEALLDATDPAELEAQRQKRAQEKEAKRLADEKFEAEEKERAAEKYAKDKAYYEKCMVCFICSFGYALLTRWHSPCSWVQ